MKFFTTFAPLFVSLLAAQTTLAAPVAGSNTQEIATHHHEVHSTANHDALTHEKRWRLFGSSTQKGPKLPKDIAAKAKEADALFQKPQVNQQPPQQQPPVVKAQPEPKGPVKSPLVLGPDAVVNAPKLNLVRPKLNWFGRMKAGFTRIFKGKPKAPVVSKIPPGATTIEF